MHASSDSYKPTGHLPQTWGGSAAKHSHTRMLCFGSPACVDAADAGVETEEAEETLAVAGVADNAGQMHHSLLCNVVVVLLLCVCARGARV